MSGLYLERQENVDDPDPSDDDALVAAGLHRLSSAALAQHQCEGGAVEVDVVPPGLLHALLAAIGVVLAKDPTPFVIAPLTDEIGADGEAELLWQFRGTSTPVRSAGRGAACPAPQAAKT